MAYVIQASADDSGQGLQLFVLFAIAVLAVTAAVGLLALSTSWWVLGVVFGIHALVTVIVGAAVFAVLSGDEPELESDNRVQLAVAASPEGPVQPGLRSSQTWPTAA